MKCPVDTDTDLVMSERQGVEIDYCPKCRGVWLDRGELDKILERSAQELAQASAPPAQQQPAPSQAPPPGYAPAPGYTPPPAYAPQQQPGFDPRYGDRRYHPDDKRYYDKRRKKSFFEELFD